MVARLPTLLLAGAIALLAAVSQPSAAPFAAGVAAPLPRVTLIGDSVATAILYDKGAQAILARGVDLRLELAPCRRVAQESCPYEGARAPNLIELVEKLGKEVGPTAIVSVGYNDYESQYAADMEAALDALHRAGVERVIWATLRATRTTYLSMNDTIEAAARRHPEMSVADWNLYSRSHPEWFWDDGLHVKGEGARAMATLFHRSLDAVGVPLPEPLRIQTRALPAAVASKAYVSQLAASGGRKPYRWARGAGFPGWLSVTVGGRLSGRAPDRAGTATVVVRVRDAAGAAAWRRFKLRIRTR